MASRKARRAPPGAYHFIGRGVRAVLQPTGRQPEHNGSELLCRKFYRKSRVSFSSNSNG
jgi:hypothetical protein